MLYKWLPNWWLIIWHIWGHFSHLTCILYRLLAPFNPFCKLFIICRGQGKYPIYLFFTSITATVSSQQPRIDRLFQLVGMCNTFSSCRQHVWPLQVDFNSITTWGIVPSLGLQQPACCPNGPCMVWSDFSGLTVLFLKAAPSVCSCPMSLGL